jgi:hypothetical protein
VPVYEPFRRFAGAIVDRIGEATARRLFFAPDGDLISQLRRAMSPDRNLFFRDYALLDQGKVDDAVALLRDAPTRF